tara:strand:- start:62 stop:562 length:501 start_codon:yes stop_codon:yes gene_type:complete
MASNKVNFKNPLTWFAIGFGTGLSPFIPGTAGTLLAILVFYFLIVPFLKPFAFIFILTAYVLLVITSFFFGLYLYKKTMTTERDAKIFVWDEFVGMWIASFPLVVFESFWPWIILSFVLFRIFDIWKPQPIRYFDRLDSPYGVMMDDVIAGLFSALITTIAVLAFY